MSLTINPEGIPAELRARAQWVVWRYEEVEGRKTKVPYACATGKHASTKDATTWTAFEAAEVCCRARNYDGLGYVFDSGDPYVGIDLDHCLDPETGEIEPEAAQWLALLDSYSERTPSGEGIHVICRGSFVGPGRKNDRIEMYQQGRFFTMTGQQIAGEAGVIAARDFQVKLMYGAVFPPKPPPAPPPPAARRPAPVNGSYPDDAALVDKVLRESKYVALWRGDTSAYAKGDNAGRSEADLALCGRIAFFAGPAPAAIDRIFRQSGLWRDKWDSPQHGSAGSTYGADTIAAALAGKSEFYDWNRPLGAKEAKEATEGGPSVASFASFAVRRAPDKLEPEALYGLAGDVVRAIDPHTESHPAAVLASLLIGMGCLIGRRPFVYRDGGRHTANEFAVLVGLSAKGRKGTASRRVNEVLKCLSDSNYTKLVVCHEEEESLYDSLSLSGLGSGEALIEALAEKDSDRRRIIVEEEFSRCLKVMRREGSTLSETLRAAWDGGTLSNRTKGKHLRAAGTHVSIIGHITEDEMKAELAGASLYNGFANRFLWICCGRSKSLPLGGGKPALAPLVTRLQETLIFARQAESMEFDAAAQALWTPRDEIYDMLISRPPGLVGAVTSRAEAHVTRLAMLYALLDLELEIQVPHLLAALAFWDFAERSCDYLFGRSSGDDVADRIEDALWAVHPGGLTRKEIHDIFQRHAPAGSIPRALLLLETQGKAEKRCMSTPGRAAELWSAKTAAKCEGSERSERSPLERARELAASAASSAAERQ